MRHIPENETLRSLEAWADACEKSQEWADEARQKSLQDRRAGCLIGTVLTIILWIIILWVILYLASR